jgi:hypothetical protein
MNDERVKAASTKPMGKEADWVRDMHTHFEHTGSYRPEDVERVLGDQRKTVLVSTSDLCLTVNGVIGKKRVG